MAHDGTSHPDLPNAPGLTSSEPTPLPNAPGLTSVVPENVEDLVESPISLDALAEAMPSEPVCPSIPGIPSFPEAPDPAAFGKLASDKVDSKADAVSESYEDLQKKAKEKKDRIKNPPSASDMMSEMATQVSSAADKAAKALEKAAIDAKNQVQENLAAEWENIASGFSELEAAMEAVKSGAIDLGSLGMDVLSIPGDALAAAFPGFKSASECLKGAPESAEAEFNKKAPELAAGVDDGRGKDGATAALAVTEQSEVVANETGEEVSTQAVLTEEKRDEIEAAKKETMAAQAKKTGKPEKPITAKPVPVSANALPTERDKKAEYSSYMRAVGQGISGNQFTTFSGRKLTAPEQIRYDAGLPPIFVSAVAYYRGIEWGATLEESQEYYDNLTSAKAERRATDATNDKIATQEKIRQRRVDQWKNNYSKQGKALPPSAEAPYSSGIAPHKAWSSFGKWHPASYDVQANYEKPLHPDADAPHITVGGDIDYEMIDPIIDIYGNVYEWIWRSVPDPRGATNADGTPLLVEEQALKKLR